eukprot:5531065-Pyramimonas_sp.AAC.1
MKFSFFSTPVPSPVSYPSVYVHNQAAGTDFASVGLIGIYPLPESTSQPAREVPRNLLYRVPI